VGAGGGGGGGGGAAVAPANHQGNWGFTVTWSWGRTGPAPGWVGGGGGVVGGALLVLRQAGVCKCDGGACKPNGGLSMRSQQPPTAPLLDSSMSKRQGSGELLKGPGHAPAPSPPALRIPAPMPAAGSRRAPVYAGSLADISAWSRPVACSPAAQESRCWQHRLDTLQAVPMLTAPQHRMGVGVHSSRRIPDRVGQRQAGRPGYWRPKYTSFPTAPPPPPHNTPPAPPQFTQAPGGPPPPPPQECRGGGGGGGRGGGGARAGGGGGGGGGGARLSTTVLPCAHSHETQLLAAGGRRVP
jgi:hypothetical protein